MISIRLVIPKEDVDFEGLSQCIVNDIMVDTLAEIANKMDVVIEQAVDFLIEARHEAYANNLVKFCQTGK